MGAAQEQGLLEDQEMIKLIRGRRGKSGKPRKIRGAGGIGRLFGRLQSGNLQGYAVLFGLGVILVIYFTVFVS